MNKLCIIAMAAISMAAVGCKTRIADFTAYSTKNIDIAKSLHRIDTTQRVSGRDTRWLVVCVPLGMPNIKDAADIAIAKVPNCVGLSDVAIYDGGWWGILTGQTWFEIEGNPIFEVEGSGK